MTGDQSGIGWLPGDVPVSERFDDPYFSHTDGLAETRHTFLAGNGLPARLRPGFHVAELGVGTGLNLLALALAADDTPIRYTGFEAYPISQADLARALAPFPPVQPVVPAFLEAWSPTGFTARIGTIEATMIVGDARAMLPVWEGQADAWFLDGFAPARNPELWEAPLLAQVARHTAPGGTFATYTAAGHVRRALAAAGFTVERVPGYGTKRHMTRGARP